MSKQDRIEKVKKFSEWAKGENIGIPGLVTMNLNMLIWIILIVGSMFIRV